MKVKAALVNICIKALAESMVSDMMLSVVKEVMPNYDIYKQTGFPQNMAIPNRDIARQIIMDVNENHFFPPFILELIKLHRMGYRGRPCSISYMDQILKGMRANGLIYDPKNHIFVEDPTVQRTRNWNVFREGQEAVITLLKIDIVDNSVLVKENPKPKVDAAYEIFRNQVFENIERVNGRIWNWEGDGGIGAFYFGDKKLSALLSAINILHEILYFNLFKNELVNPLQVRIALHDGRIIYSNVEKDLFNNETVKQVINIESKHTRPNTITISDMMTTSYDAMIKDQLESFRGKDNKRYYRYSVQWEE
ncbi:MAG: hypothetical protein JXK07_01160 [Spirochaetes bacterium]|nr:hypothetical protein [Spirochaetota bacterium]MBN2769832.1 hypothetical protein [Spirochaetota bacterium]